MLRLSLRRVFNVGVGMDLFLNDVRYAFRLLLRNPAFAIVAVITLALGIGANTAIFSVVNTVLLRPLPFQSPDQLVRITADMRGLHLTDVGASPGEAKDFQDRTGIFQGVSGMWPISANVTETDQPERIEALATDFNYFNILGSSAEVGRVYDDRDYDPGIAPVAVISYGLWERRFGKDPHVLGRKLRLDNDLYSIIGVMPREFRHPGRGLEGPVEVWIGAGWKANPFAPTLWRARVFNGLIARLKPGISPQQAQQRLEALVPDFRREFPNQYTDRGGWTPRVLGLQTDLVGPVRNSLIVLMSAVGLVMLIACVNVANLLLVRASGRGRELALRAALGAARWRLIRQLLAESMSLSIVGGLLGIVVARLSIPVLTRFSPTDVERVGSVSVDSGVLLFTILLSVFTGILFGLVPALHASRTNVVDALKDGSRVSSGLAGGRVRNVLVVSELAFAVVLLVSAALLIRSFWRLQQVNPGFQKDHIVAANVWLPAPNDPSASPYNKPEARAVFYRETVRRVGEIPGVESAAAITGLPLTGQRNNSAITVEGRSAGQDAVQVSQVSLVSEEYFRTMGIPLLRGRGFDERDDLKATPVAIVSRDFARRFLGDGDPIGKRIINGRVTPDAKWITVVGMVGDVKAERLDGDNGPMLYLPVSQVSGLGFSIVMRTRADLETAKLGEALSRAVRSVDPNLPVFGVQTIRDLIAQNESQRRFAMLLLVLFAGIALLLAGVGVYGVISYAVGQRTREIGIRLGLGASPAAILRLVLGQGVILAVIGVAAGLAGSVAVTRLLRELLFGVTATDAFSFALVPLLLAGIALLATWWPARRASQVDPLIALRYE